MTRTRNMADLLDSSGDVKSGALDNVPASNDASALTTGTLPAGRLPATIDGRDLSVDGAKLDGIEASADVTDTANVTSAGALMTTGGAMSGNLTFGDGNYAAFGAGLDLQILHNGNNSFITDAGVGDMYIRGDNSLFIQKLDGSQNKAQFITGGAVNLMHNGTTRFSTTAVGIAADQMFGIGDGDTGIALGANGADIMQFYTGNTERARITSGGSVGVGLATPTMNGNGIAAHIHSNTSSTAAGLRLTTADSGSGATDGLLVAHWSDGNAYVYNYENSNLIFGTNHQNRMIVTPSGVDVTGTMYASGNIGLDSTDYIAWANNSHLDFVVNGGIEMRLESDGDLHVDGNITAYSTTVSDPRLKTDIEPVTDALAKVEQLNGYTFTYKHDGSHSAGVVSTEVADVLPSAIRKSKVPLVAGHDNETEYDIVQYDQLHALLIEAVKELSARVKELENDAAK